MTLVADISKPVDDSAALSIRNVHKSYGRQPAVSAISFDVPRKTLFGLLGANGAGKTTLFSLIAGFLRPDLGTIRVLGLDNTDTLALSGKMTILPQDAVLTATIPVLEQLTYMAELGGLTRHEAWADARRALERVGLGEAMHKSFDMMSHGMAKRVGLAQAFLGKPELILLDEPTSGLDPANARAVRDLVLELRQTSTVVISSHMLREIQDMCSHVAIMDRGRLLAADAVSVLTGGDVHIRIGFNVPLTTEQMDKFKTVAGVQDVQAQSDGPYLFRLNLKDSTETRDNIVAKLLRLALDANLIPRSLAEGASLEAQFLAMTGGAPPIPAYTAAAYTAAAYTAPAYTAAAYTAAAYTAAAYTAPAYTAPAYTAPAYTAAQPDYAKPPPSHPEAPPGR